jgi:outer membrane protein assembly factor BamB
LATLLPEFQTHLRRTSTHVIRPNPEELEVVASNSLGESTNATPAISEGELFIRTYSHLYCIA